MHFIPHKWRCEKKMIWNYDINWELQQWLKLKKKAFNPSRVISGPRSPTWVFHVQLASNISEAETLHPVEALQPHSEAGGGGQAGLSCGSDPGCANENPSPCCCDLSHRRTPSLAPQSLLERSQHYCPGRCRDCALSDGITRQCGQAGQRLLKAVPRDGDTESSSGWDACG
jgi:hypothetical protein